MADEPTEPTATPEAGVAAQPAATPNALTADQVKAMIEEATTKAFNSGAAAARREADAKAKKPNTPAPTPNDPNPPTAQPAAQVDGFALSEAMAEFALTKDQRKKIREFAGKENPDNLDEFVGQWAGLFGAKKAGDPAASTNTTTAKPNPDPQKPAPSLPAPGPTQDRPLLTALKAMDEETRRDTWQAYVRQRGAVPGNPYDPRNRAVWRELRQQGEAALATARVQLGARRE